MDKEMRRILHIDMDAFFASVEIADQPSLAGRAVVVGGAGPRSVVAAASYRARAFGIHSAMAMSEARRRCAELVIVPPRHARYQAVSAQIFALFHAVTDYVEPLSLDEAYLDVSELVATTGVSATHIAEQIRRDLSQTLGLSASAGVSYCKFVAKLASDVDKPNGITVVRPEAAKAFLAALPVSRFYGVGPATSARLQRARLLTGADLQDAPVEALVALCGSFGQRLKDLAHGIDPRPVGARGMRQSLSQEHTFDLDQRAEADVLAVLRMMSTQLAATLNIKELRTRQVAVKLRSARFIDRQRQRSVHFASADPAWINAMAAQLCHELWTGEPVRLVGLRLGDLEGAGPQQLQLCWD